MTIQCVVIEIDFGVDGHQPFGRHHQRIDLDQAQVLVDKQAIQIMHDMRELLGMFGQTQGKYDLATLVIL